MTIYILSSTVDGASICSILVKCDPMENLSELYRGDQNSEWAQ